MGRKIKDGKLLYHLTKLKNLDSIIKNGLLSRNELISKNIDFSDVANKDIIEKRKNINDYIPFHFHQDSAFDVYVKKIIIIIIMNLLFIFV